MEEFQACEESVKQCTDGPCTKSEVFLGCAGPGLAQECFEFQACVHMFLQGTDTSDWPFLQYLEGSVCMRDPICKDNPTEAHPFQ